MARIDAPAPAEENLPSRGSQSRLSAAIFFVLLAALLFRVVTGVANREAAHAQSSSDAPPLVRWTPLETVPAVSGASGKPVLYDFTAAWCGPCHRLDAEGWGDAAIASLASDDFVPARVVDREREEGKNPPRVAELQQRYSVQAFPTLVVATPGGDEIGRLEGWGGADSLRRFLEESKAKASRSGARGIPDPR
jgi:thiol:disulfide interchange protein